MRVPKGRGCEAKFRQAMGWLSKDREGLLAFDDELAELGVQPCTIPRIKSTFPTVHLRT